MNDSWIFYGKKINLAFKKTWSMQIGPIGTVRMLSLFTNGIILDRLK